MRAHEYTTPIVDDDRRPSPSHPLCCRLLAGRSSAARGKAVTGQDGAATSGARPIGVARARGKRGGCAVARTTGGAGWVTANVMKIQTIDPLTRPRGDREALTCFCMRMGEQSLTGRTPSPSASGSLCAVSLSLFRIAPTHTFSSVAMRLRCWCGATVRNICEIPLQHAGKPRALLLRARASGADDADDDRNEFAHFSTMHEMTTRTKNTS